MSNTTETARLRELLGAATKGSLHVVAHDGGVEVRDVNSRSVADFAWHKDAVLFVALRDAAPAMLDELDALRGKAATYDELKENLPVDWPCQHPETGVSVLDDVKNLIADRDALRARVAELEQGIASANTAAAHYHQKITEAQDGLAARDASMRREGAAEEIETTLERWHDQPFPEYAKQRAARLREGGE